LAAVALLAQPAPASSQSLGTFTWQLQPFCNRVTVSVVQAGGIFTLDGVDDQCGAAQRVPLTGLAAQNPDGSIGFGLALVLSTGVPLHITARITPATGFDGTWRDSHGNSGPFAFGANSPGSGPRPVPTSQLADGSVTTAKLAANAVDTTRIAPGAVGLSDINATEVQRRVAGVCPSGHSMTAVNADGTVACQPGSGGDITAVAPGSGLTGGGTFGDVTLAIPPGGVTSTHLGTGSVVAGKIASEAIFSSLHIRAGTIEMSDIRQNAFSFFSISSLTVPARGCVVRETGSTTHPTLAGDLLLARANGTFVFPNGIYTMPLAVHVAGRSAFALCNGTAADITSPFSIAITRVPN
jgi:hypothetical protein